MAKEEKAGRIKTAVANREAKSAIMRLDGNQFVQAIVTLCSNLEKRIEASEKEQSKLETNLIQTFKARLAYIKETCKDGELTKQEKLKCYNDYMDTSKAFEQYLKDREEKVEREKEREKNILIGTVAFAVTFSVAYVAAKKVVEVCKSISK